MERFGKSTPYKYGVRGTHTLLGTGGRRDPRFEKFKAPAGTGTTGNLSKMGFG